MDTIFTHGKMDAVESYDLLVVGGGINGTGIARDAAGRGLSVLLCEQDDLAAHTSSASTKLIHGGLRYLEERHFALVRKALQERELLLGAAPHIMRPLRFVMPHDAHLRPMWMIRAGLFLYDHLARRRRLAASSAIDLRTHPAGGALQPRFIRGFTYSDGWVDDARLVVLNAQDAALHGATVATGTRCERIELVERLWRATLHNRAGSRSVVARAIVNATGPWVNRFVRDASPLRTAHTVRLVKGSHIVVPRLFAHRFAYIFQNTDRRIVFAIPYEHDFTLIGTTDIEHYGDPVAVQSSRESSPICAHGESLLHATDRTRGRRMELRRRAPAHRGRIDRSRSRHARLQARARWRCGAPPLGIRRQDHDLSPPRRRGRRQARRTPRNRGRPWTQAAVLPGGDLPEGSFAAFLRVVERRYAWLPPALRVRYARAYGTNIDRLLGNAASLTDLGKEILPQLYEREVEYLCREEWAQSAADILWRRTKLGLHTPPESAQRLDDWLARR